MGIDTDRVDSITEDGRRAVKSFVLRGSRLATYQKEALDRYANEYTIPVTHDMLNFHTVFGNDHPVIIEIGFGMGTSTHRIASLMPEYNYIGIEVFLNGFTKLLHTVGTEQMNHVRLIRFDAVEVLNYMVKDGSVAGFHIFFPDPWPKKRHHKRRLIQEPFAQLLASKLKDRGYIYCVTDWEPYAEQMLAVFQHTPSLYNPHGGYAPPRSWRPTTSFERKGIEKHHPINEVWVEKQMSTL